MSMVHLIHHSQTAKQNALIEPSMNTSAQCFFKPICPNHTGPKQWRLLHTYYLINRLPSQSINNAIPYELCQYPCSEKTATTIFKGQYKVYIQLFHRLSFLCIIQTLGFRMKILRNYAGCTIQRNTISQSFRLRRTSSGSPILTMIQGKDGTNRHRHYLSLSQIGHCMAL